MDDEAVKKAQEYWKGLGEAPYSSSFKWVDGAGFEHLSTCRAWSGQDLYDNTARLIAHIQETGGYPAGKAPAPNAPQNSVDAAFPPIGDAPGRNEPTYEELDGSKIYTVAQVFHDQTKNGKDVLKVVTVEPPFNTKFGVACFYPGDAFAGWKNWQIGGKDPIKYAPPAGAGHVVIQPPAGDNKYANVLEFRP